MPALGVRLGLELGSGHDTFASVRGTVSVRARVRLRVRLRLRVRPRLRLRLRVRVRVRGRSSHGTVATPKGQMSAKWKSSPLRSRVMKYLVRVRARVRARLQVRARVRLQVRGRAGARGRFRAVR